MENTIQSKTVKLNGVSLIFEIERKGDFSSDIRVCDYSAGRVSIYRINKDHEWEVYDMTPSLESSSMALLQPLLC